MGQYVLWRSKLFAYIVEKNPKDKLVLLLLTGGKTTVIIIPKA